MLRAVTPTRFVQTRTSHTEQTLKTAVVLVLLLTSCCFAQAGVEESRKEQALYIASWLVFWANGPTQAHECFCGDELAVRDIRTSLLRHPADHSYQSAARAL